MKVLKVISDKTFTNNNGKTQNVVTYLLVTDNGKTIPILPNYKLDDKAYAKLDMVADVKDNRARKSN